MDMTAAGFAIDMLAERAATTGDGLNCAFATLYVALP
jgi:hypothetical protein